MRVEVNGMEQNLSPGISLIALLSELHLTPDRVAIELNMDVIDRKHFDSPLKEGDKIEIIHFVGGGAVDH
jgi:sulfur carrier protein